MMADLSAIAKIAGIKQVALIADDWTNGRQRCVDLLCRYLALPVDASDEAEQHVRQVLLTEIGARLRDERSGWHGLYFDFSRARLHNLALDNVYWIGSTVSFSSADISNFAMRSTVFDDSEVDFTGAELSEGVLSLRSAQVLSGTLIFSGIKVFDGSTIDLSHSEITGGQLALDSVEVLGGIVDLSDVRVVGFAPRYTKRGGLAGASLDFSHCLLRSGQVDLSRCHLRRDQPELEKPRRHRAGREPVTPDLTEAATAVLSGQSQDVTPES